MIAPLQRPSTVYRFGLLAISCVLWIAAKSQYGLSCIDQIPKSYSVVWLTLCCLAMFPLRLFFVGAVLAAGSFFLLSVANEIKVSLTWLPITLFDLGRFLGDPVTVLKAVGVRGWTLYAVALALGAVAAAGMLIIGRYVLGTRREPRYLRSNRSLSALFPAAAALAIFGMGQASMAAFGQYVHDTMSTARPRLWEDLWRPESQAALYRNLGALGYFAFSATVPEEQVGETGNSLPIAPEEIQRAVSRFVVRSNRPDHLQPNIVLMQAESTFDPNYTFDLASPVDLPLWSRTEQTQAVGPLRTNVIGGGSFVTEYETIVGADSRMFGYAGYYTHYTLAPVTKNSLAIHLVARGYDAKVFYSTEGSFYNAWNAYRHYGFGMFVDGRRLLPPAIYELHSDQHFVEHIVKAGYFQNRGPYFYFVVTGENHGPHACVNYKHERDLVVRFRERATFVENCALNEYVRRARSTSAAFALVLSQLRSGEVRTGRPFLLVVYGDHQPWSFTDGIYTVPGGAVKDTRFESFARFRARGDQYQTFFHVVASSADVIKETFPVPPPATLLPTLISAFVASASEDLYLPINFYAYAICGSDLKSPACRQYSQISRAVKDAVLNEPQRRK